jgi:hypothetical protein
MPIQTFEPMTKDFPTFDCDAHITEPPLIWERASEFLTRRRWRRSAPRSGGTTTPSN